MTLKAVTKPQGAPLPAKSKTVAGQLVVRLKVSEALVLGRVAMVLWESSIQVHCRFSHLGFLPLKRFCQLSLSLVQSIPSLSKSFLYSHQLFSHADPISEQNSLTQTFRRSLSFFYSYFELFLSKISAYNS